MEQGRVALAKDVGNLACCLVHPEAECTPSFTPKHGYVILTTCSHVLEILLEGPSAKEVTPTVHQAVLENLWQCLKHHQSGLSASALSTPHSLCAKGLMNDRRHIRLMAGYASGLTKLHKCLRCSSSHVATELIRLYQTNDNDKASRLMDSVLRGLKRPDPHKETALLALGYIAKYVRKCVRPQTTVQRAKSCCGPSFRAGHLFDIFSDRETEPCYPRNSIPTSKQSQCCSTAHH